MFQNYLKTAVVNLLRNKFYAGISIAGLAVAIASFVMIRGWVSNELSYDRHFRNADRIFRIENILITNNKPKLMAEADTRLSDMVRNKHIGVEAVTRVLNTPTLLSYNGNSSYELNAMYVDTPFFDVFAFRFLRGNSQTALKTKGTIVIDEQVAAKLFGNVDPIGKTIYFSNTKTNGDSAPRVVTGVIKTAERTSHFHPSVVIPRWRSLESFEQVYALFKKGYTPADFERQVWKPLYDSFFREDYNGDRQQIGLSITPLTDIHLTPNRWGELEANGSRDAVYIFSGVALFILVIAAINYTNLATATSHNRAREISMRKVLGATKHQLAIQFLTEAVVIALCAALAGLSLTEMTLPLLSRLMDIPVTQQTLTVSTVCFAFAVAIITGVASGLYPALRMSGFAPANVLKEGTAGGSKPLMRTTLVIFQFMLSYVALVATMVAANQMTYIRNADTGFNKSNVLVMNLNDAALKERTEEIKTELKKHSGIVAAAASYNTPGEDPAHSYLEYESPIGMTPSLINAIWADYDFPEVLGLQLLSGPGFNRSMLPQADTTIFAIMNESAVKAFKWDNAIGKKVQSGLTYGFRKGTCVGVVKDFHLTSLLDTIAPMYMLIPKQHKSYVKYNYLSLKIKPEQADEVIAYAKQVYRSFSKQHPFEYFFLNDRINGQYEKEKRQGVLFRLSAGICMFISCIGLLGLVSFATRQRDREIAIRKVSGATVTEIVLLLCTDYLKPVMAAFVIAVPLSYYVMNRWLAHFAYHTTIGLGIFFAAGAITLVMALATVSIHTIRAANKEPAFVLRHE